MEYLLLAKKSCFVYLDYQEPSVPQTEWDLLPSGYFGSTKTLCKRRYQKINELAGRPHGVAKMAYRAMGGSHHIN
jgi:hypothetical protein